MKKRHRPFVWAATACLLTSCVMEDAALGLPRHGVRVRLPPLAAPVFASAERRLYYSDYQEVRQIPIGPHEEEIELFLAAGCTGLLLEYPDFPEAASGALFPLHLDDDGTLTLKSDWGPAVTVLLSFPPGHALWRSLNAHAFFTAWAAKGGGNPWRVDAAAVAEALSRGRMGVGDFTVLPDRELVLPLPPGRWIPSNHYLPVVEVLASAEPPVLCLYAGSFYYRKESSDEAFFLQLGRDGRGRDDCILPYGFTLP